MCVRMFACVCVCMRECVRACRTVGLGQDLVELLPVVLMEDVVGGGVDELLLFVLQVLGHVVRDKHNAALPVHHK